MLCLCLAGALLYLNSLHNEFVFDDTSLVLNNQRIQTLKNIPDILGFKGHFSYRPLRELSYVMDYQITGLNPVGYHLFNLLYHILSSYVVFLIASLLSKDRKVGLITALLFVAHPIQTESVTYISGRRDILTSLFYFIGFYSFLRFRESPSKRYLLLFFVSYFLSILSKEMGVTLPAVVLVYDFLQLYPRETGPERPPNLWSRSLTALKGIAKRRWAFYLTFFLMALLFTIYKVLIRNPSQQEGFYGGTMASNFLTVFRIWVFYIQLLILPVSQNVAHSFSLSKSLLELKTVSSLLILLALFLLLIQGIRRRPLYSFCGFWFFITLLPVSQIFPHHELLAEHYLYLPSFGFVLLLGLLCSGMIERARWRPLVYGALAALLLFYSFQTVRRNLDWENGLTLWRDAARKSPDHLRVKMNLANALIQSGEGDQAFEVLKSLIETDPKNFKAYNSLGVLYLERKELDRATEAFQKTLQIRPSYVSAHNNLGKALALKGDVEGAILEFKEAIRVHPWRAEYHFNLAKLYENNERIQEAIEAYEAAVKSDPRFFDTYYHLGILLSKTERFKEAIPVLEKALTIHPDSGKIHFILGVNFLKLRQKEKAIDHFEGALRLATNEKDRQGVEAVLIKLKSVSR